jgi:hypothetical protein
MTGWSMQNSTAVAAAYDFSTIGTLTDVGSDHGYLPAIILKSNPPLRGVLHETPEVCAGAGLRMTRIVPTAAPTCVVEGVAEECGPAHLRARDAAAIARLRAAGRANASTVDGPSTLSGLAAPR